MGADAVMQVSICDLQVAKALMPVVAEPAIAFAAKDSPASGMLGLLVALCPAPAHYARVAYP